MSESTSTRYHFNDTAKRTTLASSVAPGDGTIEITEAKNLPSTPFLVAVWKEQSTGEFQYVEDQMELMEVTVVSSTTLTVNRGVEGTATLSFTSGDLVEASVQTAAVFDDRGPTLPSNGATPDSKEIERELQIAFNDDAWTEPYFYHGGSWTNPSSHRGAVLLPTGRVCLVPNGGEVGIYDPETNTVTVTANPGVSFRGGALSPGGIVIFAPQGASNVGRYDPTNGTYSSGAAHGEGGTAFAGAVTLFDGRIVFPPLQSANIGIYDPAADSYTSGPAHGESGTSIFQGGVLLPDGRVAFVPYDSPNVGIFDPSNDSYTSGPAHGESTPAFTNGSVLPDGRIVFAPYNSSNVGLFDPSNDSYSSGPTHGQGNSAFTGASLMGDGRVAFAPFSSTNFGVFDYRSDSFTAGPNVALGGDQMWGSCPTFNGNVVMAPATEIIGEGVSYSTADKAVVLHPLVN